MSSRANGIGHIILSEKARIRGSWMVKVNIDQKAKQAYEWLGEYR